MIWSLLAMLLIPDQPTALQSLYDDARQYDRGGFRFSPPAVDRMAAMRALVTQLAASTRAATPPGPAAVAAARAIGFELARAVDAAGETWVLRESGGRRAGDGFYVFRPGGRSLCIQAPHTFFDQGTGEIALAVFAQLRAAFLFVNTVHRYVAATTGQHAADVAHADETLFLAATDGLLKGGPLPVVQFHGFAPRKTIAPDVLAIISDGTQQPGGTTLAARLRAALQAQQSFGRVLLFGQGVHQLGATTNVQADLAHRAGAPFVHIEMSVGLRDRLRKTGAQILARALEEALR